MPGDSELLEIVDTLGIVPLGFHASESGQKHCCENSDDGDHDQQFDEGEAEHTAFIPFVFHAFISFIFVIIITFKAFYCNYNTLALICQDVFSKKAGN